MATRTVNVKKIEEVTHRSWSQWLEFFKKIHADKLSHPEIAEKICDEGVAAWWAQNITVYYEQQIGRRKPGQNCTGKFAVSIGKTLVGNMDTVLEQWLNAIKNYKKFAQLAIANKPAVTKTEKYRYWRCTFADGSCLNVNFNQKTSEKTTISIQHEKLSSSEEVDHWRAYWKEFLQTKL